MNDLLRNLKIRLSDYSILWHSKILFKLGLNRKQDAFLWSDQPLQRLFVGLKQKSKGLPAVPAGVVEQWLAHKFSIFGQSEWNYSIGPESESQKAQPLYFGFYNRIAWNRDFSTGFEWPQDIASGAIRPGQPKGVEIKVPWELGRFQHWPPTAWYCLTQEAGDWSQIQREFQNQVLDFATNNPCGKGVQWTCAMDVAIRAVNIAVAWDWLCEAGLVFSDEFTSSLRNLLRQHYQFLWHNLEWRYRGRSLIVASRPRRVA
jgi:hypothetical protein